MSRTQMAERRSLRLFGFSISRITHDGGNATRFVEKQVPPSRASPVSPPANIDSTQNDHSTSALGSHEDEPVRHGHEYEYDPASIKSGKIPSREVYRQAWQKIEDLLSEFERLQFALRTVGGCAPGIQAIDACHKSFVRLRRMFGRNTVSLYPDPHDNLYKLFHTEDDSYYDRLHSVFYDVAHTLKSLESALADYSRSYCETKTMYFLYSFHEKINNERKAAEERRGRYNRSLSQYERKQSLQLLMPPLLFDVDLLQEQLKNYCDEGIPIIKSAQKIRAEQYLNLTSIATFLSLVTVTLLLMTTDKEIVSDGALLITVNTFLFGSLTLSVGSAVNSLLTVSWLKSDALMPSSYLLNTAPILSLALSVALFVIALCLFVFSSSQHHITSLFTVTIAGSYASTLLGLSSWFILEKWRSRDVARSVRRKSTDTFLSKSIPDSAGMETQVKADALSDAVEWVPRSCQPLPAESRDEYIEIHHRAKTRHKDGGMAEEAKLVRRQSVSFFPGQSRWGDESTGPVIPVPISNSEQVIIRPKSRPIYRRSAEFYNAPPPDVKPGSTTSGHATVRTPYSAAVRTVIGTAPPGFIPTTPPLPCTFPTGFIWNGVMQTDHGYDSHGDNRRLQADSMHSILRHAYDGPLSSSIPPGRRYPNGTRKVRFPKRFVTRRESASSTDDESILKPRATGAAQILSEPPNHSPSSILNNMQERHRRATVAGDSMQRWPVMSRRPTAKIISSGRDVSRVQNLNEPVQVSITGSSNRADSVSVRLPSNDEGIQTSRVEDGADSDTDDSMFTAPEMTHLNT